MTIIERIEIMIRHNADTNTWVNVYDNTTEYNPNDFGFFLEDYEEYKEYKELLYELDNENHTEVKGEKICNLGYSSIKEYKKMH